MPYGKSFEGDMRAKVDDAKSKWAGSEDQAGEVCGQNLERLAL